MRMHEPVLNGGTQKRLLFLSTNALAEIECCILISELGLCEDPWWTIGKEDFLPLHLLGWLEEWRDIRVRDTRTIRHVQFTACPTRGLGVRTNLLQTIEAEQPHGYPDHDDEQSNDAKPLP